MEDCELIFSNNGLEVYLDSSIFDIFEQIYNDCYQPNIRERNLYVAAAMKYLRTKIPPNEIEKPTISTQVIRINRGREVVETNEKGLCFQDALELIQMSFDKTDGEVSPDWKEAIEDIIYQHYYNEYNISCYAHYMDKPMGEINFFIALHQKKTTFILFCSLNEEDKWYELPRSIDNE